MPEEWKEAIVIPIYRNGDETDCSNYRGISLLPDTYKILSNILLPRLYLGKKGTTTKQCISYL